MENDRLIESYFENGELKIKEIVNEYSKYIFTIIQNISKNVLKNDDIEELISDVFVAIWKNQNKLEYKSPIKPYLAGIARNIAKNKLRSLNIYIFDSIEENEDFYDEEIEEVLEAKEKFEIIENALKEFEEDGKIFVMFYYQGKKSKEIAQILNKTEFNINTKLHRMRKKIKLKLEERGYYYGK